MWKGSLDEKRNQIEEKKDAWAESPGNQ